MDPNKLYELHLGLCRFYFTIMIRAVAHNRDIFQFLSIGQLNLYMNNLFKGSEILRKNFSKDIIQN
jgi:hypothetical protein